MSQIAVDAEHNFVLVLSLSIIIAQRGPNGQGCAKIMPTPPLHSVLFFPLRADVHPQANLAVRDFLALAWPWGYQSTGWPGSVGKMDLWPQTTAYYAYFRADSAHPLRTQVALAEAGLASWAAVRCRFSSSYQPGPASHATGKPRQGLCKRYEHSILW